MFSSKDIFLGKGGASGYQISRSVRLRQSASAYFNRTPSSNGSRQIMTFSFWMKRGLLTYASSYLTLFSAYPVSSSVDIIAFSPSSDSLRIFLNGSVSADLITTQVFRDPSAWYHVVVAIDTTQATASNRIKMYVNGSQITSFSTATYPTQNYNTYWNSTSYAASIGANLNGPQSYFDGYLTEINFIDGQQLTPSSFGATSTTTGVWGPAKYTGTYGTNGFYLNFSDNSNNTATTIGKDSSGNGNNWTPNNISVTAGTTYDSMVDSPTPYGTDTGAGGEVRGNYAVWNPLTVQGSSITYSNANLAMNWNSSSWRTSPSTFSLTSGKWYAESEVTQLGSATAMVFGASTVSGLTNGASTNLGDWSGSISIGKGTAGAIFAVQGSYPTAPQTIGSGDYNLVAIDCDNGKAWLGYYDSSVPSTTWYSSAGAATGNPATGANPTMTFTAGTEMVVAQGIYNTSTAYNANFGQRTWVSTCPSGFKALCTQNLSTPTIANGASYMAATTYTGTGASLTIANTVGSASFYPDFVWVKGRSGATDHALYDSVRGTTKDLVSNSSAAETTQSTGLTAFGSTGFTVGALAKMNTSAATYVGWQWLAGAGSSSSNTDGNRTSTVSANPTAGFSVVTWTFSTSANNTIGHGLGVAPSFIIVKDRSSAVNWDVYHVSLGYTQRLILNSTGAAAAGYFAAAPTSTVFSMTTAAYTNNDNIVAYCFAAIAGYSAFGSWTNNNSTSGTFTYLGFRPRFILLKNTDNVERWFIFDSSRQTYNIPPPATSWLVPNDSSAEGANGATTATIDLLSNGFKIYTTNPAAGEVSFGTRTYAYAAFAENPFKYALAR